MKKVIRLTESDLEKIVKRIINEGSDNGVQKLVSLLVDNGLVNEEDINIEGDNIEIYGINGLETGYFLDNHITLHPYSIDNGEVYVEGQYYEEEIDEKEYEEVMDYIYNNWEPKLGIEFLD